LTPTHRLEGYSQDPYQSSVFFCLPCLTGLPIYGILAPFAGNYAAPALRIQTLTQST